jgi:hypothetical protein
VTHTELRNSERVTEFPARMDEILRYAQDDREGLRTTAKKKSGDTYLIQENQDMCSQPHMTARGRMRLPRPRGLAMTRGVSCN